MQRRRSCRRRCGGGKGAVARGCAAGLALLMSAGGPAGVLASNPPGFRFAQQQGRLSAAARVGAGGEGGVRSRAGVRAAAAAGAGTGTGTGTMGTGDFPDNMACKAGGTLPGSRSQPGLEQTCCCQVCPAQFLVELQLMELSADEAAATFRNFHAWHRARLGLEGPAPVPQQQAAAAGTLAAAAAVEASAGGGVGSFFNGGSGGRGALATSEHILAFLEAESAAAAGAAAREAQQSQSQGRARFFGPSKAGDVNMVTEAGPCCPLCPTSFAPRRADAVALPLVFAELHAVAGDGEGEGERDAATVRARSNGAGRQLGRAETGFGGDGGGGGGGGGRKAVSRKKQTRGVAGRGRGPVPPPAAAGAGVGSFLQTAASGVFNDNAALSKSMSDRTGEGNPVCCNVCLAQESVPASYTDVMTHPDQMAKTGYPVTGNKFANKVVGVGKRDSCCVLCRGNHDGLGVFSSAAEWEPYDGEQPPYNFMGGSYLMGQMGGNVVQGAGAAPSSGRLTLPRNNQNFRKYDQSKDFQDETYAGGV